MTGVKDAHAPTIESTTIPRPADRRFRGDIDGLRAVAIILVVAYHINLPGISGGFIGVDVFFVISGYLITRNLLVESGNTGRVSLASFWARRVRRLVPAMSLMVVVTLVASLLILPAPDIGSVVDQGASASLYLSNIYFARQAGDYFAGAIRSSPFLHTWSLGVEEQFYVVWPVIVGLVALAVRKRRVWLRPTLTIVFGIVLVVSFALSLRLTNDLDSWAFYGLQSRAWEFAVAGLLAIVAVPKVFENRGVRSVAAVVGLLVIVVTAMTLTGETPYPGAWALLPVTGTVLVILAGSSDAGRPALPVAGLASTPAQWIGRVSYSWYLWHWPFIILMGVQFGDSLAVGFCAAGISLVVAAAGHHYVENPVRFHRKLSRSWRWSLVMGAVLTVVSLLAGQAVLRASSRSITDLDQMVLVAQKSVKSESCAEKPVSPGGVEYCLAGDLGAERTIMVIGDSHAQQWSKTIDTVAQSAGIRIVGRWRGACPPWDVNLKPGKTGAVGVEDCKAFRADTLRLMDELQPDAVIVSNADFYEHSLLADDGSDLPLTGRAAYWGERYKAYLDSILGRGIPVGVLRDNPQLPAEPLECVSKTRDIQACNPTREDVVNRTKAIAEVETAALDQIGGIPQMATFDTICDKNVCRIEGDGFLRYFDTTHLTNEFTDSQSDELRQLFLDTLALQR